MLMGNAYPPASHGVRFLDGILVASSFFCCSAAMELALAFALSNEVTSILTSYYVSGVSPSTAL